MMDDSEKLKIINIFIDQHKNSNLLAALDTLNILDVLKIFLS